MMFALPRYRVNHFFLTIFSLGKNLLMLGLFLSSGLFLVQSTAAAEKTDKDATDYRVKDLSYGVALYEYFQQNYFYAMREIMVAQQQQSLPNHQAISELLLGGIQLSYGMDKQARKSFEAILDSSNTENSTAVAMENHARAWFYLGKLAEQKNNIPSALDALSRIDKQLSPDLHDELAFLHQKLALQHSEDSSSVLSFSPKLSKNSVYRYYRDYNQAVNAVRTENTQWKDAAIALEQLHQNLNQSIDLDNRDELLELRDKVLTTLGHLYLRQGLNKQAINSFTQVQQDGTQTGRALVGYGWASINHNEANDIDYAAALTPWLKLQSRSMAESSTYEALLAVPFIYNASGFEQQALNAYDFGLNKMTHELNALAVLRDGINKSKASDDLSFILSNKTPAYDSALTDTHLSNQSQSLSGDHWLNSEAELFEPAALNSKFLQQHLSELLATKAMRAQFGQLNDIYWLASNLQSWRERLDIFDFAVNERQLKSIKLLADVSENEFMTRLNQLLVKQDLLSDLILQAQQPENVSLLFTETERKSAVRIESALLLLADIEESTLNKEGSLPSLDRLNGIRQKLEKMQMILFWQASNDQADRLWKKQKLQQVIESELHIARQHVADFPLLAAELTEQSTLLLRLNSERQRVEQQATDLAILRGEVEENIVREISAEIKRREVRLKNYIGQLRLSKAVLLDRQLSGIKEQASGRQQ